MPLVDTWDWAVLFYAGTVSLKMPERRFWRCSPRKFQKLFDLYVEIHSSSDDGEISDEKVGYIDNIIP